MSDSEWIVVSEEDSEETKIVFDTVGDSFTGVYLGPRRIENEDGSFMQHRFAVGTDKYFTNGNHSMNTGLSQVTKGSLVRVTWTGEKDTGRPDPMRVFRVEKSKIRPKRNT
jgi:hypothetical protein